jgi:hypothetical protein
VVGSELVCTSITSTGNGTGSTTDPVMAWNPHLKFTNGNRGYVNTKDALTADCVLDYLTTPGSPVSTKAAFAIQDGGAGAAGAADTSLWWACRNPQRTTVGTASFLLTVPATVVPSAGWPAPTVAPWPAWSCWASGSASRYTAGNAQNPQRPPAPPILRELYEETSPRAKPSPRYILRWGCTAGTG